jgi:hypothetical protein
MSFKPWTFDYRGAGVEAYASGSVGDVMNVLMCIQVSGLKTGIQRNKAKLNTKGCTSYTKYQTAYDLAFRGL